MKPSIARIVLYTLTENDARVINARRGDFEAHMAQLRLESDALGQPPLYTGYQGHYGSTVYAGDVLPALVTKTWADSEIVGEQRQGGAHPGTELVNLRVELDGTDTYWAAQVPKRKEYEDAEVESSPGRWHWPPRV